MLRPLPTQLRPRSIPYHAVRMPTTGYGWKGKPRHLTSLPRGPKTRNALPSRVRSYETANPILLKHCFHCLDNQMLTIMDYVLMRLSDRRCQLVSFPG